jgi:hypothetical protein
MHAIMLDIASRARPTCVVAISLQKASTQQKHDAELGTPVYLEILLG